MATTTAAATITVPMTIMGSPGKAMQGIPLTDYDETNAGGIGDRIEPRASPGEAEPGIDPLQDLGLSRSQEPAGNRLWCGLGPAAVVLQLSLVNFLASFTSGVIVIGLPTMAEDLELTPQLYLWPSSIYGLTSGSTLLLAGAVADVVGSRKVDLVGCVGAGLTTLACGLSRTGVQLVVFRGLFGIAMSMHLPCSVGLVARTILEGRARNLSFSCLDLSQPLGFSAGLVLGGVFVQSTGWRTGFHLCAGSILLLTFLGGWILPRDEPLQNHVLRSLVRKVDWVGALLCGGSLTMISYVLAVLSTDSSKIRNPVSIVLLVVGVLMLVSFPIWIRYQQNHDRPMLIPNKIWRNRSFTGTCVMVMLSYAVMNSMELFSSLFFQEVQSLSAIQASIRLLPAFVVGAALNLATGMVVDKVPAIWLVLVTSLCTAGAPLLMALIDPHNSYWKGAFYAQVLEPMSADVLYTVGLIIVSEVFDKETQALAGAVFATVGQFGMSLGLSVTQVTSSLVTKETNFRDKTTPQALLPGYQASFWTMFGAMMLCAVVSIWGLRKTGRVGVKRD